MKENILVAQSELIKQNLTNCLKPAYAVRGNKSFYVQNNLGSFIEYIKETNN